jgi:hypothetical protein
MASARRNNTSAPLTMYEQQKNARVAILEAKLQELNIPRLRKEVNDHSKNDQPKTRKKVL